VTCVVYIGSTLYGGNIVSKTGGSERESGGSQPGLGAESWDGWMSGS